ncbi:LOW QUALITY PROTEIN: izumo sperm-egg fusion protein 1 [Tachyglossus aculeatus]|uniref:LOW QUALITY PROTEIN: izumo sperm-egg fusion protein 1 n=1 Tax=Tachyglossus aculeatus TaxID=9261 RepID=UPI0018F67854|nr:LOW QUALITY PROTEIN: izumo sperm-egg fusion protein 1 [Tachyglossus aculeatus]
MGWAPLLSLSLSLSMLSWAPGLGCLWCDAGVEAEMRMLRKEYLPNHLQGLPDMRKNLGSRLEDAVRDLSKLPFSEDTYMGYIDEHTLNTASWGFLNELKRIIESEVKDGQLVNQLLWLLQEQKSAFIRLISQFQKEAFCPNKCGRMLQTLIWCQKCKKQKYLCEKPPFCGERLIEIQEDEELILDCGLTWHSVSQGLTDYSFYRVWTNRTEQLLARSPDPFLRRPLVTMEDAGTYRCTLDTASREVATEMRYQVTVTPTRREEEEEAGLGSASSGPQPLTTPVPQTPAPSLPQPATLLSHWLIGLVAAVSSGPACGGPGARGWGLRSTRGLGCQRPAPGNEDKGARGGGGTNSEPPNKVQTHWCCSCASPSPPCPLGPQGSQPLASSSPSHFLAAPSVVPR